MSLFYYFLQNNNTNKNNAFPFHMNNGKIKYPLFLGSFMLISTYAYRMSSWYLFAAHNSKF